MIGMYMYNMGEGVEKGTMEEYKRVEAIEFK